MPRGWVYAGGWVGVGSGDAGAGGGAGAPHHLMLSFTPPVQEAVTVWPVKP
ncbi:hypothetical protein FBY26_0504 [Phycicoccus sp. SLBN-51]|jgi:hypothetical protein|nr:hypothetical protein FBY26_0504 [Phycicoccus sp. SLBN-51]